MKGEKGVAVDKKRFKDDTFGKCNICQEFPKQTVDPLFYVGEQ